MPDAIVRYTGGEPQQIIEAMLQALKECGVNKLPGNGWIVSLRGRTVEAPLLHLALKMRIADAENAERESKKHEVERLHARIDRLQLALKKKLPEQFDEIVDLLCDSAFSAGIERDALQRSLDKLVEVYQRDARERRGQPDYSAARGSERAARREEHTNG